MTARFAAPLWPRGRSCLLAGSFTVGAVFPPPKDGGVWHWRMFGVHDTGAPNHGAANTEQAAKNALLCRWRDFLRAAGLTEVH